MVTSLVGESSPGCGDRHVSAAPKSWCVGRKKEVDRALEGLRRDKPCVVAIIGCSGSGKTTIASEIGGNSEVHQLFPDGIVRLSVAHGSETNHTEFMFQLAKTAHKELEIFGEDAPVASENNVAYVRRWVSSRCKTRGRRCLLIVDDVEDCELVRALRRTGMWILLTTRNNDLLPEDECEIVNADDLSEHDAVAVLRDAYGSPHGEPLPGEANEVLHLCGRLPMNVSFVGAWAAACGKAQKNPWPGIAAKIRDALSQMRRECQADERDVDKAEKHRAPIFRAGFRYLECSDASIQDLFLALAVLPRGYEFCVGDCVILLSGNNPDLAESHAAVRGALNSLERWGLLSAGPRGRYSLRPVHADFARERLLEREDLRRQFVSRWMSYLSTSDALSLHDEFALTGMWEAIGRVGGDGWDERQISRSYENTSERIIASDPSCFALIETIASVCSVSGAGSAAAFMRKKVLDLRGSTPGIDPRLILSALRFCVEDAHCRGWGHEEVVLRRELAHAMENRCLRRWLADDDLSSDCDRDDALSVQVIGRCAHLLGQTREAEFFFRRALKLEENAGLGPNHAQVAISVYMLGQCRLDGATDLVEAEELLRRALATLEARLGSASLRVAEAVRMLGRCIRAAGRPREAKLFLWRALAIEEARFGAEHLRLSWTLDELGRCTRDAGRPGEAAQVLQRAFLIKSANQGPGHLDVAVTIHELGLCFQSSGPAEQVEALFRRALIIREAELGPRNVQVAWTLHELGRCVRNAGRPAEARDLLERALHVEEERLGADVLPVAVTLVELGRCNQDLGRPREAAQHFRRAHRIQSSRLGPGHIQVAWTLHQLGVCVLLCDGPEEAEDILREALAIKQRVLDPGDTDMAVTLFSLGRCLREAGRPGEAEAPIRRALAIERSRHVPDQMQIAVMIDALGVCTMDDGRAVEAERLFRRSLSIMENKMPANDVRLGCMLHKIGACLRISDKLHKAEEVLQKALAIAEAQPPAENLGVIAATLFELHRCALDRGRLREAEGLLRQALAFEETELGPSHLDVAQTLGSLGRCILAQGLPGGARRMFERALEIQVWHLGSDHRNVARTLGDLGKCLLKDGRPRKAESFFRRALSIESALPDGGEAGSTSRLLSLARCVREDGRLVEAEDLFRRALAIEEARPHRDDSDLMVTLHGLGRCIRDAGRPHEAEAIFRRALAIEEARLVSDDLCMAVTLDSLARCVRDTGSPGIAEVLLRRALAIEERLLGPYDLQIAVTLHEMALCVRETGRPEEAQELFERAMVIQQEGLDWEHPQLAVTRLELARCGADIQIDRERKLPEQAFLMDRGLPTSRCLADVYPLGTRSGCEGTEGRKEDHGCVGGITSCAKAPGMVKPFARTPREGARLRGKQLFSSVGAAVGTECVESDPSLCMHDEANGRLYIL